MIYAANKDTNNGLGIPVSSNPRMAKLAIGVSAKLFDDHCKISKTAIIVGNIAAWPHPTHEAAILKICKDQMKNYEVDDIGHHGGKFAGFQDDFCR